MIKAAISIGVTIIVVTGFIAFTNAPAKHRQVATAGDFIIDTLATDLTVPWEMVFIDPATILFTERNGKVRLLRNDLLVPKPVLVIGQLDTTKKMGLLGLCLHPAFAVNKYIYLAYDYDLEKIPMLRVVRYRFQNDTLLEPFTIIDSIYGNQNHTGCRLKFGPDAKLYITTGDADRPMNAQDLKSLNGKILRVNDDGSVPADNPFFKNDTARKEIWTYGHRNPQGIDWDKANGDLYNSEHGPTGGDEINFVVKGSNYGWPLIHHKDTREGMVSPLMEFTPSIAPSGTVFYAGNAFPQLKGHLLVACLRGEAILNVTIENHAVAGTEKLLDHAYGRIRALLISPEGYIYFSTSQNDPPEGKPMPQYDMICRMRPSRNDSNGVSDLHGSRVFADTTSHKKTIRNMYVELCASCHGKNMEGTERAKTMLDNKWLYGATKQAIFKNTRDGIINKGMPAWQGAITDKQIAGLASYIFTTNAKAVKKATKGKKV